LSLIKGILLQDRVLVVNEEVYLVKCSKKDCLIFNVDFKKAYVSVSWSFLEYTMVRFGLYEKWRVWMKACVFAGKSFGSYQWVSNRSNVNSKRP